MLGFGRRHSGRRDSARGEVSSLGFRPTRLAGCVLWLRSDLGITLNAGNVSAWADQSTNKYNVTQATAAKQPAYVASGGGGNRPYLSWAGGGGAHVLIGSGILVNAPLEIFAAGRSTVSLPAQPNYMYDGGINTYIIDQATGVNTLQQFDGTALVNGVSITINSDFILDSFYNGASSQQQLNGGTVVSGGNPGTTAAPSAATVGNGGNVTPADEWGGFIYEIIVYNRQLTTGERLIVSRYMGNLYAVTVP